MHYHLASIMDFVKPSPTKELLDLSAIPGIISFGGGFPDSSLFPVDALSDAFSYAITERGALSLQYTVTEGIPSLREKTAARMARFGVSCSAENILITQGGTQALDLLAGLLLDRGDTVICENPTYMGAMSPFDVRDVKYVGVDMDDDGMNADALEAALTAHPEAKLIYLIPDFQNPTGVTLSLERRRRIVELANRFDLLVIEDCPYSELRYEGEPLPHLASFDTQGRVITLGSFSKILCPGIRLGWIAAHPELIRHLTMLHSTGDLQCSTVNMYAVDALLERYDVDAHIARMNAVYRGKMQLMMQCIAQHFPKEVRHTKPQGGMFLWLTLPEGLDAGRMMREVLVPKANVLVLPGEALYCSNPRRNTMRVNFSNPSLERIEAGISAMGAALRAAL